MLQHLPSSLMTTSPIVTLAKATELAFQFSFGGSAAAIAQGHSSSALPPTIAPSSFFALAATSKSVVTTIMEPRPSAVLWMALSMALHFGGYEFARSSNLALFTSPSSGFSSPAAFPLAMACASPMSLLMLLFYGNELNQHGPKVALRHSTLGSIAIILLSSMGMYLLPNGPIRTAIVGFAFVFQNSYAHLLYTQHWSFLGSIMNPGSPWFSSIGGLSSIASTLTGSMVGTLGQHVGLLGLLACTAVWLVGSLACSERAYGIAEKHGFDPSLEVKTKKKEQVTNPAQTAITLFQEQPTLKALFLEVVSFQSLSTILNVCFVTKLKSAVSDDVARAAWTGKFYASISAVSGMAQFLVLPLLMSRVDPKWAWKCMPFLPMACTAITSFQGDPSLLIVALAFFSAKVLDYSLRGVVNEMVYIPLDFTSRYLGKEVIGVFGNRFGKSGMSLVLSGLTFGFGTFGMAHLTKLSALASLVWMSCAWRLSGWVLTKDEAEEVVLSRRKEQEKNKA
jgi:hypothetical protein